jgi:hypothetical protein
VAHLHELSESHAQDCKRRTTVARLHELSQSPAEDCERLAAVGPTCTSSLSLLYKIVIGVLLWGTCMRYLSLLGG